MAQRHKQRKLPVAAQSSAASVRPTVLVHEARNKFRATGTVWPLPSDTVQFLAHYCRASRGLGEGPGKTADCTVAPEKPLAIQSIDPISAVQSGGERWRSPAMH